MILGCQMHISLFIYQYDCRSYKRKLDWPSFNLRRLICRHQNQAISSSLVLSTHEINKTNWVWHYLEAIVLTVAHIFNNAIDWVLPTLTQLREWTILKWLHYLQATTIFKWIHAQKEPGKMSGTKLNIQKSEILLFHICKVPMTATTWNIFSFTGFTQAILLFYLNDLARYRS